MKWTNDPLFVLLLGLAVLATASVVVEHGAAAIVGIAMACVIGTVVAKAVERRYDV